MGTKTMRVVAALATVVLLSGAASVEAARLEPAPPRPLGDVLSDGAFWSLGFGSVTRFGGTGVLSETPMPGGVTPAGSLQQLADGSVALLAWSPRTGPDVPRGARLVRFAPGSGAVQSVTELPVSADERAAMAIAPDGAVWVARICRDELRRIALDGRATRVALPRVGCGDDAEGRAQGTALAFDARGTLWQVAACAGRIDRVDVSGRVRHWRIPRVECPVEDVDPVVGPTRAVADPRGGVAYLADGLEPASGRVRNGRLERFRIHGEPTFTPDGALWRVLPRKIERRDPDGSRAAFVRPRGYREISRLVPAAADAVAIVRGSYWTTTYGPRGSRTHYYLSPQVDLLGPEGLRDSTPLPNGGTDARQQVVSASLRADPDGALWLATTRESPIRRWESGGGERLRVAPASAPPPGAPLAPLRDVLARAGRTQWLLLSCEAGLARWCTGTVAFEGGIARQPARFALPGLLPGAVPVALGERAAARLRRGGTLAATVVVRNDDGTVLRRRVRLG